MLGDHKQQTRRVFMEVADLPEAQRPAALTRMCGVDSQLRSDVEALLRAEQNAQAAAASPTADLNPVQAAPATAAAPTPDLPREREGQMIGRYKLLQSIGEGGFGSVWMAEQREPVKRRVALKIIKLGMDTRQVIARFEAERQALAMMDHPNIARVLDAGSTEIGRPYFVMEYIKGVPILEYCDTEKLDTRARVELFVSVCHAIQHAHQKGIIHRDIKPSNVLVTMHDGIPVPKVIDFGIAKATSSELTSRTLFTEHRQMIGTPAYMSPEQAEMSGLDIDTRSDIYSLGVLLYELLTGTTPFDNKSLMQAGFAEMMRIIREVEPHKPSTRLSSLGATGPRTAQQRHVGDAQKLGLILRGDLDWIVMKCLEKDRTRRYETANGLAADLQRHLRDEPVTAGAPTVGYRLRKFIKRNRGQVIAGGVVLLALIGGVIGTSVGLVRAETSRRSEQLANAQAQKRLVQIEKANDILGSIFENLDPEEIAKADRPLQAILVDKLDKAVDQLGGEAIGDALVVASMQDKFGRSLVGLGEANRAIMVLEKARATRAAKLGHDAPETLITMDNLASAYLAAGQLDLAAPLLEKTLKLRKERLGPDHPQTLASMCNLARSHHASGKLDLAVDLFEQTLELQKAKLGPDDAETLRTMNSLAAAYQDAGKRDLALPLYEETLRLNTAKLGPDHPGTLSTMNELAAAYNAAGKLDLAFPLFDETMRLRRTKLGPDHPDTLSTMNELAVAYLQDGKLEQALPLFEEALRIRKAKLGPDHPNTIDTMNNLAAAYHSAGDQDKAIPLFEEALRLRSAKLGPDHPDTLLSMGNLATVYRVAGKVDLALPLLEDALKRQKAKLGPDHPGTLSSMNSLAVVYLTLKQFDKSIPLYEDALRRQEAKLGRQHPDTLLTLGNLGVNYKEAGRLAEALPLLEESYANVIKYPVVQFVGPFLLDAYARAGSVDRVASLARDLETDARTRLAKDSNDLAFELSQIAAPLLRIGMHKPAEPLLREAVAIFSTQAPDSWRRFEATSLLGESLMGQQKFAEAEPLLIAGYKGMHERADKIIPRYKLRIADASVRLQQLYTAWDTAQPGKGYGAKAAEWGDER